MQNGNVVPLADALRPWHEFYGLLGAASATLVGLLFVAVTVATRAFASGRRAPLRVFLSASVVSFSRVLTVCLLILAPFRNWLSLGLMIVGCGAFGLGYYGVTWRDTLRDGLNQSIDLEDRTWYLVLPVLAYLIETASGILISRQSDTGIELLAFSTAMLLAIGIHNAWDITIWSVTRPPS